MLNRCIESIAKNLYVGKSKRQLFIKIKEHENKINKNSVVTKHMETHSMNFKNIKVLDKEKCFWERRISGMIHINLQKNP